MRWDQFLKIVSFRSSKFCIQGINENEESASLATGANSHDFNNVGTKELQNKMVANHYFLTEKQ